MDIYYDTRKRIWSIFYYELRCSKFETPYALVIDKM